MEIHLESLEVIKALQKDSGKFAIYPYSSVFNYSMWSEGTFYAYALDIWGEHEKAENFYSWAVENFISEYITQDNIELQIHAYGTLLWGFAKHLQLNAKEREELHTYYNNYINMVQNALVTNWNRIAKSYSINSKVNYHPATLACIYGGLKEINHYYPVSEISYILENIKAILKYDYTVNGCFVTKPQKPQMDLKLLFLAYPFKVFSLKDTTMKNTYKEIKDKFINIQNLTKVVNEDNNVEWFTLGALVGCCALLEFDYIFAERIYFWLQEHVKFKDSMYLILESELKKFIKS